jgi:NADPH:quinone reductase-like Zn-dependent oxidoreductase
MKALRFRRYGTPGVLSIEEVAVPSVDAGDVLVQVHAAAVNPSDVKNVAGAFKASLPRVPGRDYAGMAIGGEPSWNGKAVWGSGSGLGVTRDGTHAEYLVVPSDWLSEKPARLSMTEAAAVGVPYLAAWSGLVQAAAIQAGETVLITGAMGAVGQAATQIAHWKGAKVFGADRLEAPVGIDAWIDTRTSDMPTEVKRFTSGRGVDVVLDAVGGPLFEPSLRSLRTGGRQVALTSVGSRRVEFDLSDFYHNALRLIGIDTMKLSGPESASIMNELRAGFDTGALAPPTVTTWPLDRAVDAYTAVDKGTAPAKHALLVREDTREVR